MPVLTDPVPRPTALLLREAVRRHAAGAPRQRFAPLVHVGRPGVRERSFPAALTGTDHALRCDLVAALLATLRAKVTDADADPIVWLTRPGLLGAEDVDQAWLSAAATAYAEAERDLTWVVVTRHGWRDPRSGAQREWQRIRG